MIELSLNEFLAAVIVAAVVGYLVGIWLGERTPSGQYYPLSLRARLKMKFWRFM